jgi:hypothetical protein
MAPGMIPMNMPFGVNNIYAPAAVRHLSDFFHQ